MPASSCLTSVAWVVGAVVLLDWRDRTRRRIEETTQIAKMTLQMILDGVIDRCGTDSRHDGIKSLLRSNGTTQTFP